MSRTFGGTDPLALKVPASPRRFGEMPFRRAGLVNQTRQTLQQAGFPEHHYARNIVREDAARFLSQPVEAQPGSPLRVAVYSRIVEAISNNLLTPGSMLPT